MYVGGMCVCVCGGGGYVCVWGGCVGGGACVCVCVRNLDQWGCVSVCLNIFVSDWLAVPTHPPTQHTFKKERSFLLVARACMLFI